MRTKEEIEKQLSLANAELIRIENVIPVGSGFWRAQKGYITALEWVLEME